VLNELEALPLPATALIVAVAASAVVAAIAMTRLYRFRWLVAFAVPFAVAYALYWAPVWNGADSAEYSAWAFQIIAVWFISGAIACSIVVVLIASRRRSRNGRV
jgi:hypothetical protein